MKHKPLSDGVSNREAFDRFRRLGHRSAVASMLLLAGSAFGQQFVQQTTTRFPSPPPSEYTNQLTIGDIDNDGDLDILFANGGGFGGPDDPELVRVYVNDGAGFFTDVSVAATGGVSGLHRGVELGDIDRDGDLDVVLAQDFNRRPNLLVNNGSGQFTSANSSLPPIALSSSRAQFGDVDNDGDLDLFFTSGTSSRFTCGQYRLYENDGTGLFTDVTAAQFPIGNVCNNMDAIFGDIDGDFDIDIRTASTGTNNSRLYRNDGTGTFVNASSDIPGDEGCYSYDFGDIDGDGDLDLLGANGGSGTAENLLKNNGAGVFTNASSQLTFNPGIDDNDSKFFDYDNDGDLDLIIGALGGSAERIYNNNGAGTYSNVAGLITAQSDSTLDVKVADLDGDGDYDVVTAQGESNPPYTNRIYMNNGLADTLPPNIIDTETQTDTGDAAGPYVIRAAILDHMTSDRNFFDKGITLHYEVDGGSTQTVPMQHSGGQIYRGELPGQGMGSMVEYWVSATDFNDNTGTGPSQTFQVIVPGYPFDEDDDGDVDLDDHADFLSCMDGPHNDHAGSSPCLVHDSDGDYNIDLQDAAAFQNGFTG